MTRPGAHVVVMCQSDSKNEAINGLCDKIRIMLQGLRSEGFALDFSTETATKWVFPEMDSTLEVIGSGASQASAAKKGRSQTIHRLHITELAMFECAAETLNAILESVPVEDSEIVIESTPKGIGGVYYARYQAAKDGTSGYKARFYPWYEQAEYRVALEPGEVVEPVTERERALVRKHGVASEQLKWYRQKVADKTQDDADQEYPSDEQTCWLVGGRNFFQPAKTEELLALTFDPLPIGAIGFPKSPASDTIEAVRKAIERDDLAVWAKPQVGVAYVVTADPSEGTGGDPGAAVVVERDTGKHVATLHGQFQPWPMGSLLVDIAIWFNSALLVCERNNHGHAVIQSIIQRGYKNLYIAPDGKPGWNNTEISRSAALDALENVHRSGAWTSPDARLIGEFRTFIVNKNGKAEASSKAHDDLVLASAISNDVIRKVKVVTYDASYDDDLPQLRV